MSRTTRLSGFSGFIVLVLALALNGGYAATPTGSTKKKQPSTRAAKLGAKFASIPLSFEPNVGQSDPKVRFISRAARGTLFFTSTGATLTVADVSVPDYSKLTSMPIPKAGQPQPKFKLPEPRMDGSAIRLEFAGASRDARVEGLEPIPGVTNYFVGKDPSKWHRNVAHFGKVKYTGPYPGIDAVFYGNGSRAEYDLNVAPSADPSRVRFHFDGSSKLEINSSGDLVAHFGHDQMVLHKPAIYQQIGGHRKSIDGGFAMLDSSSVRVNVGKYDRRRELVIDPTLVWATIVGGSLLDIPSHVATDSNSNPYMTGFTCLG